ncbi:MAG: hypothetical protein WA064_04610 [Candidatus Moraniibacteriota bacterium]
MSITCGECGVFQERYCLLKKKTLAGDCSLYPEIPTILVSDRNPKCTKARPKGDCGVFSWGYREISVSSAGSSYQEKSDVNSLDSEVRPVSCEDDILCTKCSCFNKELNNCPVFSQNKNWDYAKRCKSFVSKKIMEVQNGKNM